ncbi:hypothetical protein [Mesobacillus subterraneus]|uniref:hypothetical protein n=1 Tax=Mesobacillus subterraneus TaxID=285983 RepID=UPI00147376C3|nr:hypothetical protein [Mesobacillus subterraneus]
MKKLTVLQAMLTAALSATILTGSNAMTDWNNTLLFGLFAFIITLSSGFVSQILKA